MLGPSIQALRSDISVPTSDGDPGNTSSIVSSFVTAASNIRQCNYLFPNPDGTPGDYAPTSSSQAFNANYKGWNIQSPSTFFVNGQFDPWRSASLSSVWGPAYLAKDTANLTVIPGARHCWDQSLINAQINPDVLKVQTQGIGQVRDWLESWYRSHSNATSAALPALASQVGQAGGKPLTDLVDMGTPSADPPPGSASGSAQLSDMESSARPSFLTIFSLVLNGVLLSVAVLLGYALFRARRKWLERSGRGHDRYTRRVSMAPTMGYRDIFDAGDQSGEHSYEAGPAGKGRGSYKKVGYWLDD